MISVIVPALNEEGAIGNTVTAIGRALELADLQPFEIIVVDDGSSDRTAHLAAEAGALVLRNPGNAGYGLSLKRGIEAASYSTIAITDADGTYPVGDIPTLYEEYKKGFDMIVGQRGGEHYRESWLKMPLRRVLRFLVEYSTDSRVNDVNSGLRIFDRDVARKFFPHLCDTFSFTTSLTLSYLMNKRFVGYVPISYAERVGRSKVKLVKDSVRTIQYIVEAIAYYNPLKFFLLISFLCLCTAVLAFLGSATLGLFSGFLIGIGMVLMAVLSMLLGMLAAQLKQILHK